MRSKPILFLLAIFCWGAQSAGAQEAVGAEDEWSGHLKLLNELSERRRTDSFFVNQQSPENGLQVGYVNLSAGNLTFLRRDLVTVGRMPIVAGRVYDSQFSGSADFGPGWRLSLDERLESLSERSWRYTDESGSRNLLQLEGGVWTGRGLEALKQRPDGITVILSSGWEKVFTEVSGEYRLQRVVDPQGNRLELRYEGATLVQITNDAGRWVSLERRSDGRVLALRDDQRRIVRFQYDAGGRLEAVNDLGGYRWHYSYRANRLTEILDPLGQVALAARYNGIGRTLKAQVRGQEHEYIYRGLETRVRDAKGQETAFRHNDSGITLSVLNSLGVHSEVRLDTQGRVESLVRDGSLMASFQPGSSERLTSLSPEGTSRGTSKEKERAAALNEPPDQLAPPEDWLFDDRGRLTRRQSARETVEYGYDRNGDVLWVEQDGAGLYRLAYDQDGQVVELVGPGGARTTFEYNSLGRLAVARLSDGEVYHYRYDDRGLRLSAESESTTYRYRYDAAGRLTGARWQRAEESGGYDYDLDARNRIVGIRPLEGERIGIDYDANGNVTRYANRRYRYDALDRLIGVSDDHGTDLARSYDPSEPDIVTATDQRTPTHEAPGERASAIYGTLGEIFHGRGEGSWLNGVTYDSTSKTLRPTAEAGAVAPDVPLRIALLRTQMDRLAVDQTATFNAGSNAFFLPPELRAINCNVGCNVTSLFVRVGGSPSLTVSVTAGISVLITGVAFADCIDEARVKIDANGDGIWETVSITAAGTHYTYNAGSYIVRILARCLCTGIEQLAQINVVAHPFKDRQVMTSGQGGMSGIWLNSSGTASAAIFFTNTLRESYTVRETFVNNQVHTRQILAGRSTHLTNPTGFPTLLPYDAINVLNVRHRFNHGSNTAWHLMTPATGPGVLPPDAVFRELTSNVAFPINTTGYGQSEVQQLGLRGHPATPVSFPMSSLVAGLNGLIHDQTETSMTFNP